MLRGLFVTGTDTNVGKTVVSAALMARYRAEARLRYWKPIQTGVQARIRAGIRDAGSGIGSDDDTAEVARLSGATDAEILTSGVRLQDPVSPHLAAQRAGTRITVRSVLETVNAIEPTGSHPADPGSRACWIIEGAGGVLVPINERETMADLIAALDLPVVVAARSGLGTINHTLMTIEVLRRRMQRVAGVVMVGEPNDDNRLAIEKYGSAEVIGQMPRFDPLTPEALGHWAQAELDRQGVLFVAGLR
jgi:dethiobiotin synthetase